MEGAGTWKEEHGSNNYYGLQLKAESAVEQAEGLKETKRRGLFATPKRMGNT